MSAGGQGHTRDPSGAGEYLDRRRQQELVRRYLAGDPEALGALYEAFRAGVEGYISGRLGAHGEAEDLSQESFALACTRLQEEPPEPDLSFYRFLKTCADEVIRRHRLELVQAWTAAADAEAPGAADEIPHSGAGAASTPSPDDGFLAVQAEVENVRFEMLRLVVECCGGPHEIIAFGFARLLQWEAREVASVLGPLPLGELAAKLSQDYAACLSQDARTRSLLETHFNRLLQDILAKPPAEVYPEAPYTEALAGQPAAKTAQVPLQAFFAASPEESIREWCSGLRSRVRRAVTEGRGREEPSRPAGGWRQPDKEHLTLDDILAYASETVSEADAFVFDSHLGECEPCAARVHCYHTLRERFDELWESWSAKGHAMDLFRAHLHAVLAEARFAPELVQRVLAWVGRLAEKTGAVLGISMDRGVPEAKVFEGDLRPLLEPSGLLRFQRVEIPVRISGAEERRIVMVEAEDPAAVQVTVDPAEGEITVRSGLSEPPWPLAMLVPLEGGAAEIRALEQPPDSEHLVARFEDVADGDLFLFLERP